MDPNRFDDLARHVAHPVSRRRTFGVLAAGALAAFDGASAVSARHKKHKCKNGHKLCSGVCVNVNNDENNCGKCGNVCTTGDLCKGGSCVCTPQCQGLNCGPDGCGGSCGTCSTQTICQGTTLTTPTCESGVCTPVATSCATGQVCFQNVCCKKFPEPKCHKTSVSDHCGGTYPPNCSHFCCDTGPGGTLVCQTNPCP